MTDTKARLHEATEELLALIDRTINAPIHEGVHFYSLKHRMVKEDWSWGYYADGKMYECAPAPVAVLWEEGPDDWTTEITLGEHHEEAFAIQKKHDVLFEPYTSWAMGVYDLRGGA